MKKFQKPGHQIPTTFFKVRANFFKILADYFWARSLSSLNPPPPAFDVGWRHTSDSRWCQIHDRAAGRILMSRFFDSGTQESENCDIKIRRGLPLKSDVPKTLGGSDIYVKKHNFASKIAFWKLFWRPNSIIFDKNPKWVGALIYINKRRSEARRGQHCVLGRGELSARFFEEIKLKRHGTVPNRMNR